MAQLTYAQQQELVHGLLQPVSGDIEEYARTRLYCLRDGEDCTEFGPHGCVNCARFRRLMRQLYDIWTQTCSLIANYEG